MKQYAPRFTVEELARQQGVTIRPLDDLLSGPWSEGDEDDVDEFLAMLRGLNNATRKNIDEKDAETLLPTR